MSDTETFYQAVCPGCTSVPGEDEQHFTGQPRTKQSLAEINARTHDRLKHDGEATATVRAFEAESLGNKSDFPKETPPIEGEESAEAEA